MDNTLNTTILYVSHKKKTLKLKKKPHEYSYRSREFIFPLDNRDISIKAPIYCPNTRVT